VPVFTLGIEHITPERISRAFLVSNFGFSNSDLIGRKISSDFNRYSQFQHLGEERFLVSFYLSQLGHSTFFPIIPPSSIQNLTINHLGHALNFPWEDNEFPVVLTLNWDPEVDCIILKTSSKPNAKTGDQLTYFGKTMPVAGA
jgi:hypothetical protein